MKQGNQTAAYDRIMDVGFKVEIGAYCEGDDLDIEALKEDLLDVTADM